MHGGYGVSQHRIAVAAERPRAAGGYPDRRRQPCLGRADHDRDPEYVVDTVDQVVDGVVSRKARAHYELVRPEPSHVVAISKSDAKAMGDDAKNLVTCPVAIGVVHRLEAVQIAERDGDLAHHGGVRALESRRDHRADTTPVRQSR